MRRKKTFVILSEVKDLANERALLLQSSVGSDLRGPSLRSG